MTYTLVGATASCDFCNKPLNNDSVVLVPSKSKRIRGRNGSVLFLSNHRVHSSCLNEFNDKHKVHEVFVKKIKLQNSNTEVSIKSKCSYTSCFFGGLTTSFSQVLTTGTLKAAALVFSFFSIVSANFVAKAINKHPKTKVREIIVGSTLGSLGLAGVALFGNPLLVFSALAGITTTTATSLYKIKTSNLKEENFKLKTITVGIVTTFIMTTITNFLARSYN